MDPTEARQNGSANGSARHGVQKIIFLLQKNASEPNETMQLAYDSYVRVYPDTCAVWKNEEQYSCESVDTAHKVFVCDDFEGDTFRNLRKNKARIFGPLYILDCCENAKAINSKQNLIFSSVMKGLAVCFTNTASELRKDLQAKVQLMGGVCPKGFTKDVTHLVAGEVGSKKYHVACNLKIPVPVMLPDWINECWRLTQKETFHASDKRFDKFICPIFKGLTVTVSQLDGSERKEVQRLIEKFGGIYSGDLKVGQTTHLVLQETTGQKFKVAERSQIFCVTSKWVYESVKNGFCVDENLYSLSGCEKKPVCASTPTKLDTTSMKDLSCASTILSKTIDETVLSNASMLSNMSKTNLENTTCRQSVLEDQALLRKLEMCKQTSGLFLDGCKIMLSGFSYDVTEKLRKFLNAGGATRFNQLNENVSHVILGDKKDDNYKSLLEGKHRPHIVNVNWLIESITSGKPVDEAGFKCLEIQANVDTDSPFSKSKLKPNDSTNQPNYSSFTVNCASKTDELDDEVMSQYVSGFQDETVKIFQGYSFVVLGFDEVDTANFKTTIIENGGIPESSDNSDIDVAVVPINGLTYKVHACTTVTNFWMLSCIDQGSFLEVSDHPLFSPIAFDLTKKPLSGCVFSLSQFNISESECLAHLIRCLGGRFQDCLSRQAITDRGAVANTHLIAKIPEGSKYTGALNWGLPVVNFQWLLACAKANKKLDEAPFVIGTAVGKRNNTSTNVMQKQSSICDTEKPHLEQQLVSTTKQICSPELNSTREDHDRIKAQLPSDGMNTPFLNKIHFKTPTSSVRKSTMTESILQIKERIKNGYQTPIQPNRIKKLLSEDNLSLNSSSDSPGLNTPSKFLNPDFNACPKFDIRDAMSSLESPLQEHSTTSSRRSLNLPLEDMFFAKVSQALRYEIETTGGIVPNRSMDDLLEDTSKATVLSAVVIVVSKKLMHLQSELNKLTEQMGGRYRWKYDRACTHFIHQGKVSEYNKELKTAQDDGKIVVSPEWLFACQQKQMRVEEHLYPFTFNPQLVLDVSTHNCSQSCSRNEPTINSSPVKTPQQKISLKNLNDNTHQDAYKTNSIMETANKQMDEIFAVTKIAKDKRTRRPNLSAANSSIDSRSTSGFLRPLGSLRKNSTGKEVSVDHWAETLDCSPISWDDPTSRLERERLAEHLAKNSESFSQVCDLESHVEQPSLVHTPVLRKTLAIKFLLAGLKTQERQQVSSAIKNFSCCLLESNRYEPSCTHLIIGFLNRTEKCLAAIASGKWVMRPSYIYECEKAGKILKEEDYEWASEIPNLHDELVTIAKASRRWRIHLQNLKSKSREEEHDKIGAFQDWKVILYTSHKREDSFKRLLEAGAAKIVSTSPPFTNMDGVTHAFLELSQVQSPNIDISSLLSAGIHCVKPDYIAKFLLEESLSNIHDSYVSEAIPFLKTIEVDAIKRKSDEKEGDSKRTRKK